MKRFLHFVNEMSLGWFLGVLALTILGFAVGYYMLAQSGSLIFMYETDATPSFLDSLYFSVVTISSLGYGDIRPEGGARLLVALEVLSGLAFVGLLVAKISSVKQDYILSRMYSEAVDTKLATYVHELEENRNLYRITAQLLMEGGIDPGQTTTFRRDTPGSTFFSMYRQLLVDVHDLFEYEASNGALFGHVDDSRIDSVYDAIRGVLRRTTILWEKDSEKACDLVLCDNGPEIEQICDLSADLARLGLKSSKNTDTRNVCAVIVALAEQIKTEILPNV